MTKLGTKLRVWLAKFGGKVENAVDGGSITLEVYQDGIGQWRWRMRRGGRVVADGAEGYSTKHGAGRAAFSLLGGLHKRGVIFAG